MQLSRIFSLASSSACFCIFNHTSPMILFGKTNEKIHEQIRICSDMKFYQTFRAIVWNWEIYII